MVGSSIEGGRDGGRQRKTEKEGYRAGLFSYLSGVVALQEQEVREVEGWVNEVLCAAITTALRLLPLVTRTVAVFVGLPPDTVTGTLRRRAGLPKVRFECRGAAGGVGAAAGALRAGALGVLGYDVGLAPAPPQPHAAVRLAPVPHHLQEDGLPP